MSRRPTPPAALPFGARAIDRRRFLGSAMAAALVSSLSRPEAAVSQTNDSAPGLPSLLLPHPSGAQVRLYLQGAHVASWQRADGEEVLFMSRDSAYTPGVPIRGGIPLVFPQFATLGPLPNHGILRTIPWAVTATGQEPGGAVFALLERRDDEATRKVWPHSYHATYRVSLDDDLSTTLTVTNTGREAFSFQSSLHTYLRVDDVRRVTVEGLQGARYLDRAPTATDGVQRDAALTIERETDRIYVATPGVVRVVGTKAGRSVVVEKDGFADTVVWNPWIDKARALADFGDDEYPQMVCIEPANIVAPVRLAPGATWRGTQRLRVT